MAGMNHARKTSGNTKRWRWLPLLVVMAMATTVAGAVAQPDEPEANVYTGCLNPGGQLKSVAIGDQPLKACEINETEISWSMTGPQGPPGVDGTDGVDGVDGTNGVDGVDGTDGINGTNGVDGTDGDKGDQGDQGVPGPAGQDGLPGSNGQDGQDGDQGPQGPPGPAGPQGDPGNLALAGLTCPDDEVLVGFDASGELLCSDITTPPSGDPEVCDGIDNDLDGVVDNNLTDVPHDGILGTVAVCDGELGEYHFVIRSDWCVIDGDSWVNGQSNPADDRLVCDPSASQTEWTAVPPGTA
jgi:hypothetical protein